MYFTGVAQENCLAVGASDPTVAASDAVPEPVCTYTAGLYINIPPEMQVCIKNDEICIKMMNFALKMMNLLPFLQAAMNEANTTAEYTLYIAYGSLIAWVVLGLIFCIFKQRIMISIGVIEEASDAFLDVPFAVVSTHLSPLPSPEIDSHELRLRLGLRLRLRLRLGLGLPQSPPHHHHPHPQRRL